MVNNIWGLQQKSSGFDGITKSLVKKNVERGEDCMQKFLYEHFLNEGLNSFINDVEIVFIDKTDPSDPTRREEFWRNKLKTLPTYGLNVEE